MHATAAAAALRLQLTILLLLSRRFHAAPQPPMVIVSTAAPPLFQAMKPTRTSSETFPTWPPTTPRSSSAAALTSDSESPPACMWRADARARAGAVYVHISPWLPATCWVIAQLVATPDGLKSSEQQILCASDQNKGAKARAALREQRGVSLCSRGKHIGPAKITFFFYLKGYFYVSLFLKLFCYMEKYF